MNSAAYDELVAKLKRAYLVGTVGDLLGWDEQVNLPSGSADQRAAQLAVMAELQHAAGSDPRIGQLLAELEGGGGLDADRRAVATEARRDFDRATKLPETFVREKALLCSRAYHAWAAARAGNDFAAYAPFLEKHLEFARREAELMGFGAAPYDYFIDRNDPGMTAVSVGRLFAQLKEGLVPFVRAVLGSKERGAQEALRAFPVAEQEAFVKEVTAKLGFDYARGRLDVSLHPFCSGTGADTRMTTRFDPDNPLMALFGAIHETGHGLYEQGLPQADAGTALGMHAGMGVHESQSRLWENQVGRSRGFWRHFEPQFRARFPSQTARMSSDALYRAVNAVKPGMIRVDADEVTYNLHIVLRFELEKKLFAGELAVGGLPAAWRAASIELLGREPATDREGVLQDVHWSGGAFGYFPSYCLGNMMAAQLWYRAIALMPELEDEFARGDFSRLLGWLRTNIHAEGRRHDLLSLVKKVTGDELSPKFLLRYLAERYGTLYPA